jgi:hypothetical protein
VYWKKNVIAEEENSHTGITDDEEECSDEDGDENQDEQ